MDEASFQPKWFSRPGDTLLTLMEHQGLSIEELGREIGCADEILQGIIAGTVAIDRRMAVALSKYLGGTPKFWEAREERYQNSLALVAEAVSRNERGSAWVDQFPHRDLAKYGWIKPSQGRDELLRTYLAYFGVTNPAEWEERYAKFMKQTAFRSSPTFRSKAGPLSAWLRRGEIDAARLHCKQWDREGLRQLLPDIRVLTKAKNPSYFLPRLRRLCAEVGVAVVFVRAPSGCTASGATQFITPKKAMAILSFRHLSDDHFWFTFFHEIAHLLLHGSELTFIDGEEELHTRREKEANEFAERVLVPPARTDELMDLGARREPIIRFAYSLGVAPGIVVGQLQHHGRLRRSQMNHLKRKFSWIEIESAISNHGSE